MERGLLAKDRLAHWIVEAITLAYSAVGKTPPEGIKAHSTRGVASFWALLRGVSVEDMCAAASWSNHHTFVRYYSLDVLGSSSLTQSYQLLRVRGHPTPYKILGSVHPSVTAR